MPLEPLTGARYPTQDDGPYGGAQIQAAVLDLAPYTVPRFATAAERDAAYADFGSNGGVSEDGMVCYVADGRTLYVANGGRWQPIPYTISIRSQSVGNLVSGYNILNVTLPNGRAMPSTDYVVSASVHEFQFGMGGAQITTLETLALSPTQFQARVYNNFGGTLTGFLDYTLTTVTG